MVINIPAMIAEISFFIVSILSKFNYNISAAERKGLLTKKTQYDIITKIGLLCKEVQNAE